jgi:fumarylacetoacetate (FAA) hydrolase family protein
MLIEEGVWSQYLEVGIGPDAEIFTKAQPMSSVGYRRGRRAASDLALEQSRAGESC